MLKAKALCTVQGNESPEVRPLVSVVENVEPLHPTLPSVDENTASLHPIVPSVDENTASLHPITPSVIENTPFASAVKSPVSEPGIRALISNMQNIRIESVGDDKAIPEAVRKLAVKMMDNDDLLRDIIYELRQHYIRRQEGFRLSLADWSESERKQIVELFQDMSGIVGSLGYWAETKMLKGSLIYTTAAKTFLTGQYMELAVYEAIKEILEELSDKYQTEYEIYRNVVVATRERRIKNEFDIVIRFNGIFYVVEVKSGKSFNDWGSLTETGQEYGIVPGRFMLVDSHVPTDQAECIEYFCDYYVCNLKGDSLKQKITRMISSDMQ